MSASSVPATVGGKITKKALPPITRPGAPVAVTSPFWQRSSRRRAAVSPEHCHHCRDRLFIAFPLFREHSWAHFIHGRCCHSRRALAWDAMICMYLFLVATATGSLLVVITWIMLEKTSASRGGDMDNFVYGLTRSKHRQHHPGVSVERYRSHRPANQSDAGCFKRGDLRGSHACDANQAHDGNA